MENGERTQEARFVVSSGAVRDLSRATAKGRPSSRWFANRLTILEVAAGGWGVEVEVPQPFAGVDCSVGVQAPIPARDLCAPWRASSRTCAGRGQTPPGLQESDDFWV